MSTLSATNRSRQKVLGYPVDAISEARALEVIESAWNENKGLHIVTLNAEMVVSAQQDGQLDRIIRHAHLIIPDGAGIVWALRLQRQNTQRLAGIDLASAALARAADGHKTVALLGGRPDVLERTKEILPKRYPNLQIVASHHGYFSEEQEESIVEGLAKTNPDLLLVALGVPKQEYFIDRYRSSAFAKSVVIGIGGSFDIWAGQSKRAPLLMRQLHLEWLYRLIAEPWRFKRIGSALPRFGFQVVADLLAKLKPGKHSGDN